MSGVAGEPSKSQVVLSFAECTKSGRFLQAESGCTLFNQRLSAGDWQNGNTTMNNLTQCCLDGIRVKVDASLAHSLTFHFRFGALPMISFSTFIMPTVDASRDAATLMSLQVMCFGLRRTTIRVKAPIQDPNMSKYEEQHVSVRTNSRFTCNLPGCWHQANQMRMTHIGALSDHICQLIL